MKITTWNVNGFRAVLKKDFLSSVSLLDPDILCLQELKAKEEQVNAEDISIPGYTRIWNSAVRPGYSGVGTYVKDSVNVIEHSNGLGVDEFDVEGRVIQSKLNDFLLFNIYFPNGQRGQDRIDYKLRFYERLLELCIKEHANGRNIIITGDFNTAHNEIDLANPKENSKISGFLPEERVWIDKYLENGFTDAFRQLYPDKVQYTWWTYRVNARVRGIGWRLDYYLVSNQFMQNVKDVNIFDQIQGSDHCPVTLEIMD